MIKKVVLLTEQSQADFLNKLWLENNLEADRVRFCKDGFIGSDESTFPIVAYWACGRFSKYEWDRLENAQRKAQFITFDKFIELEEIKSMNLDKIETQEEKEAFEDMANSSEIPNGSEWKNGDECIYMSHNVVHQFIGPCPKREGYGYIQAPGYEVNFVELSKLSKPETPEQKADREREEWAQNVIGELMDSTGLDFTNDGDIQVVKAMYDLNYRKQNG